MSQTKRTLLGVKRTHEARETARRTAQARWRAAVLAARQDGHTLQAIADSAGVSRQWTVRETGETVRTFKTFAGALRYAHKLEREREGGS